MKRFRTQWNRELHVTQHETFQQPSMTIPDQSMSVTELMERQSKGLTISQSLKTPVYDGGQDIFGGINVATLDLSEIEQMKNSNKEFIKQTQNDLQQIVEDNNKPKETKVSQPKDLNDKSAPVTAERASEGNEAKPSEQR